jgi:exonuclease SbcC
MVVLNQLVARDFKHLDIDITFPQGILAISGPNESGKSSIFEAILFALFGRTHKAPLGQKDRLINYDANKLFVRLLFEVEGSQYRITRQIHRKRPSIAELHQIARSGQAKRLATGVKNVEAEVGNLLNGMDLDDLLASNIVLQKDLDRLAQMRKMDRRHVINAMMGRECFSRADDKLAKELRPLRNALTPTKETLKEIQHRKDAYLEQTQELEAKQKSLTQIEAQLKEISRTFAQSEKKYKAVKAYKTAKDKREDLQREIQFRLETQDRLKKQLANLGKLQQQQKKLHNQAKQLDYLQDDMTTFQQLQETSETLKATVDKQLMTTETITKLEGQVDELMPLQDVAAEYEQVKNQRLSVEASQHRFLSPLIYIPSIGLLTAGITALFFNLIVGIVFILASTPFLVYLSKTYFAYSRVAPKLDQLRRKEEELSEQVAKYRTIESYEEQLQEQRNQEQELTEQITHLSTQVHSHLKSFSTILLKGVKIPKDSDATTLQQTTKTVEQSLLKLQASQKSITEQLQSVDGQLADLKEAEKDLTKIVKEIETLREQLSSLTLPALPDDIDEYTETLYEKLDQQIKVMGEKKATIQENRRNTRQRIDELSATLKENEGILDEFTKKEREFTQLDQNIKSGELTLELIRDVAEQGREQVRPRVVHVMERLLAAITDGKYRFPKLSEDYSLKVYSATAGEYVEATLYSGGTEDQFLLALRLGFAIALLPQGRGATPQFLLLDEPFAGSDIQRRDNIIRLLKDELTRTFQQIIVVSHQSAVLSASEHQFRMINGRIIHSE